MTGDELTHAVIQIDTNERKKTIHTNEYRMIDSFGQTEYAVEHDILAHSVVRHNKPIAILEPLNRRVASRSKLASYTVSLISRWFHKVELESRQTTNERVYF